MSVLRVENLSKRYGKKQVLKGITCEFHTGINALLGPNGAGKTTIMNCISGVIKKSGGSVTLDGQDVFEMGVIVGPGVLAEHLDGPGLEARELLAQLEVQAVEVEAGQRRDLVGAAAQGGQGKGQ